MKHELYNAIENIIFLKKFIEKLTASTMVEVDKKKKSHLDNFKTMGSSKKSGFHF